MLQISEDAYARLRRAKRPGESFSDVIVRRFPQGDLRNLSRIGKRLSLRYDDKMLRDADRLDRAGL